MEPETKVRKGDRIVVLLKHVDRTEISAPDIVRRIRRMCSEFSVTILTGTPNECRILFPGAKVLGFQEAPSRNRELPFLALCWMALPFMRYDAIFVADVISLPAILTHTRGPCLCYGNTHPKQHVKVRRERGSVLSGLSAALYWSILRRTLRKCDVVAAISPQLASVFRTLGVKPSRTRVILVGVPGEMFERPPHYSEERRRRPNVAVCTGTVSVERGLAVIVEGAKKAAGTTRDFKIRLIGCREADMALVRKLAGEAGVQDIVEPNPPIRHSEIPQSLWEADWGISLLEPNEYFEASPPLKVLEYLAAGLPVIANEISTHSLYLEDGLNSIMIPYDSEAFARATLSLIHDDALRTLLSRNARMSALRFSERESIESLVREMTLLSRNGR